ncbi:trypsin-like peptidase domain-containing protein [Telmatocola sphagniphila]|uniref:Trypsin-like peptidase domain-containing protein n=1 Tax=Telmatocola sphagniphila TaxID=1123043 RepID=A0A8E6B6Q3_9BACT|nr:serine protease [Telmatocola sphagniphila]QVL32474.1 trypsin-like peptidase domain-containing protein [Telmatocola sphagniphila]
MFPCHSLFALSVAATLASIWAAPVRGQKPADTPAAIAPESVVRVKQSTVLLKVSSEGGRSAEGSGFFAVEPGIVVTNAHVLGMLQARSKPPANVEVIVGSGTGNERTLRGLILGVDRSSDLALVKVEAPENGTLPTPLQLETNTELVETQKVYIFGFPFGTELGKSITVSESSISSLRNNAKGQLEQVQVNGGMHPGNSGGPVVNNRGQVVGVSVAVIRNTQINFAVPVRLVQALFSGRILDWTAGVPFREGEAVRVPVKCECLDPLKRIREVRVEVWSRKTAEALGSAPKDAQTQTLPYAKNSAAGDIALPKLAPGEVAWVQPIAVLTAGDPIRGEPHMFDPAQAVERIPAELVCKLSEQKERTVQLKATQSLTLTRGKSQYVLSQSSELPILESFSPNPKGALVTLGFGAPRLNIEEGGRKARPNPEVANLLQRTPPRFVIDDTNKLRERTEVNLNPRLSADLREAVTEYRTQIYNAYEAATFTLPNRKLSARESWPVKVPLLLKTGGKSEVVDLVLNCTLEGVRPVEGSPQAVVTFEGQVKGRTKKEGLDGQVTGRFGLHLNRGYISFAKMTIGSEFSAPGSDVQLALAFDIDLTRAEGNPGNIVLPKVTLSPDLAKKDTPGSTPKEGVAVKDPKAAKNLFKKPAASKEPTSYMKISSEKGDFIGQGKDYNYEGDKLDVKVTPRGVSIQVDGWNFQVGGPSQEFLQIGEYNDAKRFAFSGASPGIDFFGKGRGSNSIKGDFVVWELEIKDKKIVKLALDFVQHSEGRAAGLTGKVRINSSFE